MNTVEELGSISEHGNFSNSTKVDTRTEEEYDDTDVEEVGNERVVIIIVSSSSLSSSFTLLFITLFNNLLFIFLGGNKCYIYSQQETT